MAVTRAANRRPGNRRAGNPRAAALGLLADLVLGEPPVSPHPVAVFGSVMNGVEGRLYGDRDGDGDGGGDRDRRQAGVVHAATGAAIGVLAGATLGSPALAAYLAVAGRGLADAATEIGVALEVGNLDEARAMLPALVGRDPSRLDDKEIARAVVESVAENTVDAIVAPALWAAVAGAPGALGYRAVNTLDSMVGHRSARYERYGWASARLDDAAGWVPARVTAGLVAVVRPGRAAAVARAVLRDAPAHPSPNAGVAEAAFAAALGLRLGGENRYGERVELRPPLGAGRPPEVADIGRAVRLSRHVTLALVGWLAAGWLAAEW